MDKIYEDINEVCGKEFNVTIDIVELINLLGNKTKLNLIEFLLGGCTSKNKFKIISNALLDSASEDNFNLVKAIIRKFDSRDRQEIINYTNKLLKRQDKYNKRQSKEKK